MHGLMFMCTHYTIYGVNCSVSPAGLKRGAMAKAIVRIKKLHTRGNIGGMGKHVARARETPNADPDVKNFVLIGTGDQLADYDNRMAELGIEKVRKNAVLAVDHMLTASPEWFIDFDEKEGKQLDRSKLKKWAAANVAWLQKNYGKNVVSATLHLDEQTPHIHAIVIPEVDSKLNARALYGGREKMSAWQDNYAEAMASLGLERGKKGSKAKHQTVKKYYDQVNAARFEQAQKQHQDQQAHQGRLEKIKAMRKKPTPKMRPTK